MEEKLFWWCDECGNPELVESLDDVDSDGYLPGDHEPCIYCENGMAVVYTESEINKKKLDYWLGEVKP